MFGALNYAAWAFEACLLLIYSKCMANFKPVRAAAASGGFIAAARLSCLFSRKVSLPPFVYHDPVLCHVTVRDSHVC